jgi:hypothetical protein
MLSSQVPVKAQVFHSCQRSLLSFLLSDCFCTGQLYLYRATVEGMSRSWSFLSDRLPSIHGSVKSDRIWGRNQLDVGGLLFCNSLR